MFVSRETTMPAAESLSPFAARARRNSEIKYELAWPVNVTTGKAAARS